MVINKEHGIQHSGFTSTNIRYYNQEEIWKVSQNKHPKFAAIIQATGESLILGRHLWTIHNDSKKCSGGESYSTYLTLSGCEDTDFTCYDGSCVNMQLRCNGKTDCQDGTDEDECNTISPDLGYNKLIMPPPVNGKDVLEANLSIKIIALLDIDEVGESMKVKFTLTRDWFDTRVSFQNLKTNSDLNSLSALDKKSLWHPWIIFSNIRFASEIQKTDVQNIYQIVTNEKYIFKVGDFSFPNTVYLFTGSENFIREIKEYTCTWICQFNMFWYPFDTQTCTMEFYMATNLAIVNGNMFSYIGPKNLVEYYVHDTNMCSSIINGKQGVKIKIYLGRRLFSNVLTVFVPTIILIIISHLVNYLQKQYLDVVISVNLTVLLVLSTFFVSISRSVPTTSYIKMVEVWMIFTMTFPFIEVALHTYKEGIKNSLQITNVDPVDPDNQENQNKQQNNWIQESKERLLRKKLHVYNFILTWILPIFSVIFITVFWILGLISYFSPSGVNSDC